MLKKIIIFFLIISLRNYSKEQLNLNLKETIDKYYHIGLDKEISLITFVKAIEGYKKIEHSKNILTIIDYTKQSLKERFYVIDLEKNKILYSTYVMHGKNSGTNYAIDFSNDINSNKSSPGFYKTLNSYEGQYGYALRIEGLEKNINDNAFVRNIVIHGSKYAYPIPNTNMLSRSLGCPAIPKELSKSVIDTIKDGTVLYIYTNEKEYVNKTKF